MSFWKNKTDHEITYFLGRTLKKVLPGEIIEIPNKIDYIVKDHGLPFIRTEDPSIQSKVLAENTATATTATTATTTIQRKKPGPKPKKVEL